MQRAWPFGVASTLLVAAAPVVTSGCAGLCFHNDCGPRSVTVYLTPETDDAALAAQICFNGTCETASRADVPGARSFELPLPDVGAVDDADQVELAVTLLDASGAELGVFTDDIDIDAGECECATVDITWDGDEFDRFN